MSQCIINFSQQVLIIGNTYTLDGIKYRCEKIKESGLAWFQQLNEDGSDYKRYDGNNIHIIDQGKRIIYKRQTELFN